MILDWPLTATKANQTLGLVPLRMSAKYLRNSRVLSKSQIELFQPTPPPISTNLPIPRR